LIQLHTSEKNSLNVTTIVESKNNMTQNFGGVRIAQSKQENLSVDQDNILKDDNETTKIAGKLQAKQTDSKNN
jgi:hypothetical protein